MIKPEELRIGNLLYPNEENNTPYPVLEILESGFLAAYKIFNFQDDTIVPYNSAMPIPLSPETLEKAGFKTLGHFTVLNTHQIELGRKRWLSIGCAGTPNEMVFLTEEDAPEVKAVIVLRNYDYDGPTYLHDLQNIYQDITKKQLEIKL